MKHSNGFKIAAAVILGLTVAIWLIGSIIGMLNGVPREINNLIMIAVVVGLAFLAWKRPLLGGILLCAFAILMAIYFLVFNDYLETALVALVPLCAPTAIAGLLFIEADWSLKKK